MEDGRPRLLPWQGSPRPCEAYGARAAYARAPIIHWAGALRYIERHDAPPWSAAWDEQGAGWSGKARRQWGLLLTGASRRVALALD
eukprot:5897764-Pyramimonas_sp.AAC.1